MKKRTVITTEKREVWIISEGGKSRIVSDQSVSDNPAEGKESVTIADEEPPTLSPHNPEENQ